MSEAPRLPAGESDEVRRLRDEIAALSEALEEQRSGAERTEELLKAQLQRARDEAANHHRRLARIYDTKTWKLGWLAYGLLQALRRPRWAIARLRRGSLRQALTAGTPADRAARMPRAVGRYELTEAQDLLAGYRRAVRKKRFGSTGRRVAMAVHTADLSEGRGDVYVAVGLGRFLERIGYDVVYLPRHRWYEPPDGTDLYVALLDDLDLALVPQRQGMLRLAWIRNRTDDWVASQSLPLYDAVLCSSERSLAEVSRVYPGPAGILRIGVDAELFSPASPAGERSGVVTTVNLWGGERQLFRALRSCTLDFPLAIFGQERGLNEDLMTCWHGPASFFALGSLYRQAALVLDDHNPTTQPYGNLNSRVYEALASGALVISNAALGLAEVGLDALPTYTTPEELDELIHRLLSDRAATVALTERLQEVVLRDHTFERRAQDFDAFVRDLERRPEVGERVVVVNYPLSPGNPYQQMLYAAGGKNAVTSLSITDLATLLESRLPELGPRLVFHLHWTAPIVGPGLTAGDARDLGRSFLRTVDGLKERGVRFVWTIHNVLSHESRFPDEEATLCQGLADRADLIHVMCERTAELVSAYYTLPPDRVRVVPHPNYVDVYPNLVDQPRARAELGLRPEHTVLCFLGGIRPYKGLDRLLDAFDRLARVKPEARLIVGGPPGRFEEIEDLAERCESDPRIIANFNRIPDVDIQLYLNAADVVVMPHRAVLNSGSVMLAYSFARPVVAPALGCVAELLTPDVSLTFDLEDTEGLFETLMQSDALKDERFREAAYKKALAYPALELSDEFCRLIRQLARGS
ncbi:MAG TPA: glycosyltransferase [Actinomycetota bacterium]|nr:glycosyltransferase [Actinomycetota bacterium]